MRLFYNDPSPYARKVRVLAHELGLAERLTLVPVDPWRDPPELLAATPLAKIPALVVGDVTLTESTAIGEHLRRLAGRPAPDDDAALDRAVRTGLAQGLIDAGFGLVVESRRPPETQWQGWFDRLRGAVDRTLPVVRISGDPEGFGDADLGDITLACALAYLDFRLPDIPWRSARPDLALWLDRVSCRPSMVATRA